MTYGTVQYGTHCMSETVALTGSRANQLGKGKNFARHTHRTSKSPSVKPRTTHPFQPRAAR